MHAFREPLIKFQQDSDEECSFLRTELAEPYNSINGYTEMDVEAILAPDTSAIGIVMKK